jgi:hypothetical protein
VLPARFVNERQANQLRTSAVNQKVFISYAWQDRDRLEGVLKKLREAHGAELDLTQDIADPISLIESGQDLRAEIRQQIQSASYVVLFWTKQAAVSDWVQYESAWPMPWRNQSW